MKSRFITCQLYFLLPFIALISNSNVAFVAVFQCYCFELCFTFMSSLLKCLPNEYMPKSRSSESFHVKTQNLSFICSYVIRTLLLLEAILCALELICDVTGLFHLSPCVCRVLLISGGSLARSLGLGRRRCLTNRDMTGPSSSERARVRQETSPFPSSKATTDKHTYTYTQKYSL